MNEEINHSIEELKKAIQFSDTTCGIDFSYTVSIKDVKLTLKYIEQLQQDLEKANETINKLCNDLKIQRILNKRLIEENFNSHSRNVKARKYIIEKCPQCVLFRNEHIEKIFNILGGNDNAKS